MRQPPLRGNIAAACSCSSSALSSPAGHHNGVPATRAAAPQPPGRLRRTARPRCGAGTAAMPAHRTRRGCRGWSRRDPAGPKQPILGYTIRAHDRQSRPVGDRPPSRNRPTVTRCRTVRRRLLGYHYRINEWLRSSGPIPHVRPQPPGSTHDGPEPANPHRSGSRRRRSAGTHANGDEKPPEKQLPRRPERD
jgi:hypothetical protein